MLESARGAHKPKLVCLPSHPSIFTRSFDTKDDHTRHQPKSTPQSLYPTPYTLQILYSKPYIGGHLAHRRI